MGAEEIWHALPIKEGESIMVEAYPEADDALMDQEAREEIEKMMKVVSHIRNIRGEHGISPSKSFHVTVVCKDDETLNFLTDEKPAIEALAKLSELHLTKDAIDTKNMAVGTVEFAEILIPMTELFDAEEEKKRLEKELLKLKRDIESSQKRLSQKSFVERAPKEVVKKEREKSKTMLAKQKQLETSLEKIKTG